MPSAGRSSSASPANGTSASDSIPRARSTRIPPACPARVLEQRRLADPRLADEREHAAAAVPRLGQEPVERQPLLLPAEQHPPILTSPAPMPRRLGGPPEATGHRAPYGRRHPSRGGHHGDDRSSAVAVDGEKLMEFVFRAVDEVGATLNTALVVMGDKLGLYRALAGAGGLDPASSSRARRRRASATCASG